MAVKRKTDTEMAAKEKMAKTEVDVFTNLPDSLQLRILSLFETKYAVQTSPVSKTWLSLWKSVPVLNLNSFGFAKLRVFDNFVDKFFRLRDHSSLLESLTFHRHGVCSGRMLHNVLGYAFSHGVKNVEAIIQSSRNKSWPIIWLETSSDSLLSLKLQSESTVNCPFFESTSISFRNLSDLYLKRARILDPELFTRFPALKKLTLFGCVFDKETVGTTLKIHAPQLTDLTIISYSESIVCYQLMTPKLGFFEYRASEFPQFQTHGGLPVLDTVVVDFQGLLYPSEDMGRFNGLLSLFVAFGNVKTLTLLASVIYLLSWFPKELAKRESPFGDLKCLKLDLENIMCSSVFYNEGRWLFKFPSEVRGYLHGKSPDARLVVLNLNGRSDKKNGRPPLHIC